ncbi:AAA family ATPase, partial [Klebsiella pneumoniae]|uniref:AAA family ATPase n=2 Tax=Pseudomonadota TaxID=1224 RepID=UPI003C6D8214
MLRRLVLTDFRNHADAVIAPGDGFVVLTGDNGAGKTNILEAVSLLAPGRG